MNDELDRLVEWLKRTDRAESADTLLHPRLSPNQPVFGPNIPVLGVLRFEERASGLLVPLGGERGPGDLYGAFATASDLLGDPVPLDELIEQLAELRLEDVAHRLLTLNAFLEEKGIANKRLNDQLVEACCPTFTAAKLRPLVDSEERFFTTPQVVMTLLKLALRFCPDVGQDLKLERLGPLLLATADHVGGQVTVEDEQWALELARYGWFYSRDRQALLWGRFQRLWREIIPSLDSDPRFVDPAAAIATYTGVDYEEFTALGIGLSAMFHRKIKDEEPPLWIREDIQGTQVAPETIKEFLSYMSSARSWYVEDLNEDSPALGWDFTRFRMRPLLRHDGLLIPISLQMLAERVTDGTYYFVVEALDSTAPGLTPTWRTFFGIAWELYVRRLIHEGIGDGGRIVPEELLNKAWPDKKKCDNVIEYPDRFLLVESVAKRFTVETIATGSLEALESDLEKSVVIKARQLASTVSLLRSRSDALSAVLDRAVEVSEVTRFTPVIVLPGPFPQVPPLTAHVNDLLRADDECLELFRGAVDPVAYMAAGDFELLVGTSNEGGASFVELLDRWGDSSFALMDFRTWASQEVAGGAFVPSWLVEGGKEAIRWGAKVLFHRAPDGESD
jgi:hypothetical protein